MPIAKLPESIAEPPPIGRLWARLYAIVAGVLAVEILLFYALTRYFS